MNRRIITIVVLLIVATFVAVAAAFAWLIQLRMPSASGMPKAAVVPHTAEALRNADCTGCHSVANGRLPLTHRNFADDTCRTCHGWRPLAYVPHSISMGDRDCVLCHGDPTRDLGMPAGHLEFTDRRCTFCHQPDEDEVDVMPAPAGESAGVKPEIRHPVTGPFEECLYCHRIGQTPAMPESHRLFGAETCERCHVPSQAAESLF